MNQSQHHTQSSTHHAAAAANEAAAANPATRASDPHNRTPHRRTRRTFAAGAVLALTALGLAACGGGSAASSNPNEIRVVDYYTTDSDAKPVVDTLNACAAEQGLTLKREAIAGENLISKVLQMSSSKTLPDVLMLDNPDLQEIASSGALAPLGDFNISTEGFNPQVVEAGTFDGKVYGLAPTVNTIVLFYNTDLLAAKNIQPPTTWDELKTAATALSGDGKYGLAMSAAATYEGAWQFLPFMWSNGGDEKDISSAAVADAATYLKGLIDAGAMSKAVVNWGQGDAMDQFKSGNAAMVVNGPWQIAGLAQDAPDLKWDAVVIPVPKAGDTSVAPLGGEVWTVPQTGNPEKQAKAAKMVECMNSAENQKTMADLRFTIPSRTAAAEQFAADHPDMGTFVEQVANARARTGQLGVKWPAAAKGIYTAEQEVLTGTKPAAEAFKAAQESVK